jgi:hypothetical protein
MTALRLSVKLRKYRPRAGLVPLWNILTGFIIWLSEAGLKTFNNTQIVIAAVMAKGGRTAGIGKDPWRGNNTVN